MHRVSIVNEIDHLINMFQGHSMAVDTMRSRLEAAKLQNEEEDHQRDRRLHLELEWLQRENKFYGVCYNLYRELRSEVFGVSQQMLLKSFFEPETDPYYDPFLRTMIHRLTCAVKESGMRESKAEADLKRYWNIPLTPGARTSWL
ncbi:hypothetical protein BJX96DRAFT_30892 [Aspergillus floccosus]